MPAKKKPTPHRRPKGSGGVEKVQTPDGLRYRARKRKKGHPPALGSLRETWDQAFADLSSLATPDSVLSTPHSAPLFQDFIQSQLEGPRRLAVEAGTLERDEIVWRTRIHGSELGKTPIDEITVDHCLRFIGDQTHAWRPIKVDNPKFNAKKPEGPENPKRIYELQKGKPLTKEGLKRIGSVVSGYLEIARKRPYKYIASNPMQDEDFAYPARKREPKRRSLRPAQAAHMEVHLEAFLKGLRGQGVRFQAMCLLLRDTGVRRGELCAFQRSQLIKTLGGYVLEVDAAERRRGSGMERAGTKTGNVRQIPISNETAKLLQAQPKRDGSPYFFTTATGKPVRPDTFYRDFKRFAKAIGMPELHPHRFRHTYISLLLMAGKDIKSIQKLVGHATPKMILEIYGETFDESMADAPTKLRALLDANKEPEEAKEEAG